MTKMLGNKVVFLAVVLVAVSALIIYLLSGGNGAAVCWNRVTPNRGYYYWPDGCRGARPDNSKFCTQALTELTSDERSGYLDWISQNKPEIPGC